MNYSVTTTSLDVFSKQTYSNFLTTKSLVAPWMYVGRKLFWDLPLQFAMWKQNEIFQLTQQDVTLLRGPF